MHKILNNFKNKQVRDKTNNNNNNLPNKSQSNNNNNSPNNKIHSPNKIINQSNNNHSRSRIKKKKPKIRTRMLKKIICLELLQKMICSELQTQLIKQQITLCRTHKFKKEYKMPLKTLSLIQQKIKSQLKMLKEKILLLNKQVTWLKKLYKMNKCRKQFQTGQNKDYNKVLNKPNKKLKRVYLNGEITKMT